MKNKFRTFIGGLLYVTALFSFLGAITASSSGSMLDFSDLARLILCGFSILCVILATIIWKSESTHGKRTKVLIMVIAIVVIICGGLVDTFFTFPWQKTVEYASIRFPFEVNDVESVDAYHYYTDPSKAEKKIISDSDTITYLYDKLDSIMFQEKDIENQATHNVAIFRFDLTDGTKYEIVYVGYGVKKGELTTSDGYNYFTTADIGGLCINLPGETVPADESELPEVNMIPVTKPTITEVNLESVSFDEISGYILESGYTQEQILEKIKGIYRDNMIASWGEPDGMLSGMWGDVWYLDDTKDMRITVYYDSKGHVSDVRIIMEQS